MDFVQFKRRRRSPDLDVEGSLPISTFRDYYTKPSIVELAAKEAVDCGFCSRVPGFVVGRVGYGCIAFSGYTDVRQLNLDRIVKIERYSVVVYDDEADKPQEGQGLNKAAEVTFVLQLTPSDLRYTKLQSKLRDSISRQGARFLSFDPSTGEWRFAVNHFSRFGLDDDEDDDVVMDEALVQQDREAKETAAMQSSDLALSHSLPAHLGLDPRKMQEMRMTMFPVEEEDEEIYDPFPQDRRFLKGEYMKADSPGFSARSPHQKPPLQDSPLRSSNNTVALRKSLQPLLEYNVSNSLMSPSGSILMTGQNKGLALQVTKVDGFKLTANHETPLTGHYTKNLVDAGLFMGKSFRVGWGPNGILVHTGTPVGSHENVLSSVINIERIAIDRAVRNEKNEVKEELIDLCFSTPLNLHMSLEHETTEVGQEFSKLKLQRALSSPTMLSGICHDHVGMIEKKIEIPGLSRTSRMLLVHQVTIWELIKVLFSEREKDLSSIKEVEEDDDEMVLDKENGSLDFDLEAKPYVRRAEFSYWLQESVCHRVQEEVSSLLDSSDLAHILLLLTGRQLDSAVQVAASRGDIRLAILLSQAGGSMVNRSDMAQQLNLWRINGLDFSYIENDRSKLYELLSGNIQAPFQDISVDWKRYLGLVMWYQLPPDSSIPIILSSYQKLLDEGSAPYPVPVYVDEGLPEDAFDWSLGDRYDIAYYTMLLHANGKKSFDLLKTMFSASSSTPDPLDYHMIWHQRSILEASGAFSSNDLHVLDMSMVAQLLCLGQVHWAIYVVLHIPYRDDFPHLHAKSIKEILLQYCVQWSSQDIQRQFIQDLGVPPEWMHEALAIYLEYYGDQRGALEHFIECSNWQKAHSIFMTFVAHHLFKSSEVGEIWRITSSMEKHKSEIANWDLGAGIYIDFYILRSSLQEKNITDELVPLEKKNEACREFFDRLKESLLVWGTNLPVDARAVYSKMTEELFALLVSAPSDGSSPSDKMSCFNAMLGAPVPEDVRSCYLQDAVSVFAYLLPETAS